MRFGVGIGVGVLVALALLEALFQALPVSSGARMEETSSAKAFARYLPRERYVYSHGWAFLNARSGTTNNQGFTNSPDFAGHGGVLVIGDSYIESLMLDYSETVQGRLGLAFGGKAYAASASSNGLADSLKIAEFYLPQLRPTSIVFFVEPYDLHGLTAPPPRGHSGFVDVDGVVSTVHNEYKESSLKHIVQKSALVRYLYYNLKFSEWLSKSVRLGRAPEVALENRDAALKERVLKYYFSELRTLTGAIRTEVVFLMDGDRKAIYRATQVEKPAWNMEDRKLFQRMASNYGFNVVDMQPVFESHWAQRHERMDFLPADGHWNPVAHALASEEILKRLRPGS
jgi:hypothetical protein